MNKKNMERATLAISAYNMGREDAFKAVKDCLETVLQKIGPTQSAGYVTAIKDCIHLVTKEEELDKAKDH